MAKYKMRDRILIPAEIAEVHEVSGGVWYRVEPMNCEPYLDDDGWGYPKYDISEECVVGKFEES